MEGVSTWSQVQFFRLTSFRCPAFYCLAFCLVALVDLDLSSCDFCTTKVYFTESNRFGTIIVFIRYCNSWAVGYDLVLFTLGVFLSDIGHFHRSIMFDLECDVRYFEVTRWSRFLMEGISARCQVDVLRLTCFGCPAFDCVSFSFLALVNLDLSTGDFSTTEVDFAECHLTWEIIVLVGNSYCWTIGCNGVSFALSVFFSYASHFHCTVILDLECDVGNLKVTGWGCLLMEGVSARY